MTSRPVVRARTRTDELQRRRRALGWTLAELGRRAGVDRNFLSKVERGECNLPVYALYRVSEALACSPWDDLTEFPDLATNPVTRRSDVQRGRPDVQPGRASAA